jgi:hypothetical protein
MRYASGDFARALSRIQYQAKHAEFPYASGDPVHCAAHVDHERHSRHIGRVVKAVKNFPLPIGEVFC